jgi:predicted flap endonuclease-1-like 5' DNA nuclease
MPYEPRNPHHLRYAVEKQSSPELLAKVEEYVLKLNHALGYDFNTVEFGVVDGVPYAIDFCNPAPDADIHSVGQKNFDWIVENAANFAIERALAHKDGQDNLTWGTFIKSAVGVGSMIPEVKKSSKTTKTITTASTTPVKTTTTVVKTSSKTTATTAKKAVSTEGVSAKDDLKKIEGVGPKIEELLNQAGITTFATLAKTATDKLKSILDAAGKRYQIHDPSTWAKQAKLAADGKWDELTKWQGELKGGK